MDLLMMEAAHRRVGAAISAIAPDIRVIKLDDTGTFAVEGAALDTEEVRPALAWMSLDVYRSPNPRIFSRTILRSDVLQWVHTQAAGLDAPIFGKLADKGVRLSNSDAQSVSIADFVVGGVLAHLQRYEYRRTLQAARRWDRFEFRELGRTRWLIVGYGSIGREVAKRLQGFGTSVVGVRRKPDDDGYADRVEAVDELFDELPNADVVLLACALTDQTRNLVDADFLGAMKPHSILVNIGRGGLVVEAELLAALDAGKPEHALLDVFVDEPLPEDSPFWSHPRVVVSGHGSYCGDGMLQRGDELFLHNLRCYLAGEPLREEVDMSDWTINNKEDYGGEA